jgi:hypothetical protein
MCENSGITGKPSALRASKSGSSVSAVPVSGAPVSRVRPIELVPRVERHPDAANDHPGAACQPSVRAPDDFVEVRRPRLGVDGAVHLPEEIPHAAFGVGTGRAPEALLHPPHGGERARVLQQHPRRVGNDERIIGSDLDEQVSARVGRLEPVDREGGEGLQPRDELGAEPERDSQPGPRDRQLGLRVGKSRLAPGQARGVVGEHLHHPALCIALDFGQQVERHEGAIGLGSGVDPRLVRTVERNDVRSILRCGPGCHRRSSLA